MPRQYPTRGLGLLLAASAFCVARAHDHHVDKIPEGQAVSDDPIVGADPPRHLTLQEH